MAWETQEDDEGSLSSDYPMAHYLAWSALHQIDDEEDLAPYDLRTKRGLSVTQQLEEAAQGIDHPVAHMCQPLPVGTSAAIEFETASTLEAIYSYREYRVQRWLEVAKQLEPMRSQRVEAEAAELQPLV